MGNMIPGNSLVSIRNHKIQTFLHVMYQNRDFLCVCKCSGASEQEQYYFNLRERKYPSGSRQNRAASSGYWKATGRDKQITVGRGGQVVGMKKVLVFYKGKPPRGCRTDWIMHEYRLAGPVITGDKNPIIVSMQINFLFT